MIYSLVLVNKPVIDSDRNEKIGRIKRFVLDPDAKRILAFILTPDPGQTALEIIPYSSVKSVYNNAVIVQNLPRPVKMSDAPEIMAVFMKDISLIGTQVLTDTGMLAGAVRDFAFREKDGELVRLTLAPEKPDGVTRIGARHILKIVKARVMISALALKEPLDDEDDEPAPEYPPEKKTAPPPAAAEKYREEKKSMPEQQPVGPAPRPEAPVSGGAADAVSAKEMAELLRQLFQDFSSMVAGRLDALDIKPSLEVLKREIIESLKSGEGEPAGEKEDLSTLEILVEEKIKRGAGRHLEEIKGTLAGVTENVTKLVAGAEEKSVDAAVAEIRASVDAISAKVSGLEAALGGLSETAAASGERSLTEEKLRPLLDELGSSIAGRLQAGNLREDLEKMSEEFADWRKGALESLELGRERWAGEIKGVLESRLAENADRGAKLEEHFTDTARKLEKRIIELKENYNAAQEKMDGNREMILDEIKSFAATVMKPEDLVIIQKWLEESGKDTGDIEKIVEDINTAVDSFRTGLIENGSEVAALKAAVAGAGQSLSEKLDLVAESVGGRVEAGLAGLEPLKSLTAEAARMVKNEAKAGLEEAGERLFSGLDTRIDRMLSEQSGKLKELESNIERTVLKPSDLAAVRQWLEDLKRQTGTVDSLAGDISATVDGLKTGMQEHGEALGKLNDALYGFGDVLFVKLEEAVNSLAADFRQNVAGLKSDGMAVGESLNGLKTELAVRLDGIIDRLETDLETLIKKNEDDRAGGNRTWEDINARLDSLGGALAGEIDARLDRRLADQAGRIEKLQSEFEAAVRQLREGLKENLETRIAEFAKVGDLEILRERVEEKVGDITDRFVARIEQRLAERDDEMESGIQSILKRIEKALQKSGGRPDLGSIFGGGLLDGIFGGGDRVESQAKIPSRTSRGAAHSVPAASAGIEDSQIRRLAYLIGKKLRQDIADAEGNILARQGDVVDEAMIRLMRDRHSTLLLIRGVDFS